MRAGTVDEGATGAAGAAQLGDPSRSEHLAGLGMHARQDQSPRAEGLEGSYQMATVQLHNKVGLPGTIYGCF